MNPIYIFRLDDLCPTMNWNNFDRLEAIFDKYNVKPIVGIIPDNQDQKLMVNKPNKYFWNRMKTLVSKGWIIAQHGYQHQYINNDYGILRITNQSEFSGLNYKEQHKKILSGKKILEKRLRVKIEWWMAPSHSFDRTTCQVLKDLDFKYITDGIALYPYSQYGLTWIPQQLWRPKKKNFGLWTVCIHPNLIDPKYINDLDQFIKANKGKCENASFVKEKTMSIMNRIFVFYWYTENFVYKRINKILRFSLYDTINYFYLRIIELIKGIDIVRCNSLNELHLSAEKSHHYSSSGNKYLEVVLDSLKIKPTDSILDFGCGKGGAIITMYKYPFKKIDGIEISSKLVDIAKNNLGALKLNKSTIYLSDASKYLRLNDYTCIYMYNPFPSGVMKKVINNLTRSVGLKNRIVTIIYKNPTCHEDIIRNGTFKKIREYPGGNGLTFFVYQNILEKS